MTAWRAYTAKVIKVIDGDSLTLSFDLGASRSKDYDFGFRIYREHGRIVAHEEVRLAGLNAPEHNTSAGMEALAWLDAVLRHPLQDYRSITAHTTLVGGHDAQEKYGRWLATLWLVGENVDQVPSINQRMIAAGHAAPWDGHGPRPLP